jgi:hypothetical protein
VSKKTKEKSQIIIIYPNGEYEVNEMETLDLKTAQKLVGGYVQVVPLFNKFEGMSCVVLCDEEGKLKGYPPNTRATIEWKRCAPQVRDDMLVGNIVVVTGPARRKWA